MGKKGTKFMKVIFDQDVSKLTCYKKTQKKVLMDIFSALLSPTQL